jgi:sulfide:quinone oxidoreductase
MSIDGYDEAFAIGDATNIPISKSGVVAHLQAGVVAHNIVSEIKGHDGKKAFNGRINCPLEVGGGRALFVAGTYEKTAEADEANPDKVSDEEIFRDNLLVHVDG